MTLNIQNNTGRWDSMTMASFASFLRETVQYLNILQSRSIRSIYGY